MTATEVKRRRGTASQHALFTGAEGEITVDLTNNRVRVHDAVTLGGHELPNAHDLQNGSFITFIAGGTANALTLTMDPVPAGYGSVLTAVFKAANTNTAAATMNVNSLGAKDIYKVANNAIVATEANDIISGGFYTIRYDGTRFILEAGGSGGTGSDDQTFNSNGTWTKPSGYSSSSMVLIECWGGGGGGGGGTGSGGAGGGASSFGTHCIGYGGNGGGGGAFTAQGGGAGGGYSSGGSTGAVNDTGGEGRGSTAAVVGVGGYNTGGGGGHANGSFFNGWNSVYGGGGGVGAGGAGSAGTSVFGGNGGGFGTAGTAPAGGGGANSNGGGGCGGGGGSYKAIWKQLGDLSATETVTVGAGGSGSAGGGNGGTGRIRIRVKR